MLVDLDALAVRAGISPADHKSTIDETILQRIAACRSAVVGQRARFPKASREDGTIDSAHDPNRSKSLPKVAAPSSAAIT